MGQETTASTQTNNALEQALAAWRAQIERDLKGADFNKRLVTRTAEGIPLQPLYSQADLPALDPLEQPGQAPYRRGWSQETGCRRLQGISRENAAGFNKALLEGLMQGQDAVLLPRYGESKTAAWSPADLEGLSTALADVDLTAVPVFLPTGADPAGAAALYLAHAESKGVPIAQLRGGITGDPLGEAARSGALPTDDTALIDNIVGWTRWCATHAPELRSLAIDATVWHEAGANASQELGLALATLTEYLREFEDRGLVALTLLPHTLVTFGAGPRFFTELAKLRAWRMLVSKLLVALGIDPAAATKLLVHARPSAWNQTRLDAHVNMLRSTTAALSAVLGGVNGLEIPSFDEERGEHSTVGERIARNMHAILGEEFGFTHPQDAGGGSWYVENLTDQLARSAWNFFRQVEEQGGLRSALRANWPQQQISAVVSGRDKDHAVRRAGLVGTNIFPNLQDHLPTQVPASPQPCPECLAAIGPRNWPDCLKAVQAAIASGQPAAEAVSPVTKPADLDEFEPIAPYRAAAVFEKLRQRAETITARRGRPPTALLLKMGPVKQHKPRADFSAGFISVGGFTPAGTASYATASEASLAAVESDADVAIICSTDDTYPELVPDIARAIKAARSNMQIVLAGMPREEALVQSYRDAGVDAFIHVRAHLPAILDQLLSPLEK
jgi:methylmalonyl-CoA mutase